MKIKWKGLLKNGRALYLAYDQGLEHGPEGDFNDKNIDPSYVINIAKKSGFQGIVFQKGIAEKYNEEIKKSKIPLIIKLNGKTKLYKGEALSEQICSVDEALKLGAKAVGFTIYLGSAHEAHMISHFAKIEREAHKKGIPVMLWAYPRGKKIKNDVSRENMAYSARLGLELGADVVKIKWNGKEEDLRWAIKSAGKCKLIVAGGKKINESDFLKQAKKIISCGASGMAIGRNLWGSNNPLSLAKELNKIVFGRK